MAFLLRKTPMGSKLKRIKPRLKVFARPQPKRRVLAKGLKPAGLIGAGAVVWYLFNPSKGKARRKQILDMTAGRFRRGVADGGFEGEEVNAFIEEERELDNVTPAMTGNGRGRSREN